MSFGSADGGRWTLTTTPEFTVTIAPAEAGAMVGVRTIVAPHARLQTAVARAVTADGSIA